jgi:hypothetical protein
MMKIVAFLLLLIGLPVLGYFNYWHSLRSARSLQQIYEKEKLSGN